MNGNLIVNRANTEYGIMAKCVIVHISMQSSFIVRAGYMPQK